MNFCINRLPLSASAYMAHYVFTTRLNEDQMSYVFHNPDNSATARNFLNQVGHKMCQLCLCAVRGCSLKLNLNAFS